VLKLRLRRRARRDLAEIWGYTKQHWSADQGAIYLAAINAEFERLRQAPLLGRAVSGVQAPFRKRTSGSHVIYYLVGGDTLDVVRVLHSRMDAAFHLANDGAQD